MLICTLLAGGGVFWSAAELLYHFRLPHPFLTASRAAPWLDPALAVSFLHWGFSPGPWWPPSPPSPFRSWNGEASLWPRTLLVNAVPRGWVDGLIGHLADGLSVVAAIAGTVGPLGFLSLQLSNAAGQLPWLSDSAGLNVAVVLLTAVFASSTVSGIQKDWRPFNSTSG